MGQKLKLVFAVLLCNTLLCTTGCWDNRKLGSLSIITGVGTDSSKESRNLDLSFQTASVQSDSKKKGDGRESAPYLIREIRNRSILGGIDLLRYGNSRQLFLQHNQVIIFNSDVTKSGVRPYLNSFMRNTETRMKVQVVVAKNDARSILATETVQDKIPSVILSRMIMSERAISPYSSTNMLQFTARLADRSTTSVALVVERKKEDGL